MCPKCPTQNVTRSPNAVMTEICARRIISAHPAIQNEPPPPRHGGPLQSLRPGPTSSYPCDFLYNFQFRWSLCLPNGGILEALVMNCIEL